VGDDHGGPLEQYLKRLNRVSERGGAEMRIVIALGGSALLRSGEPPPS
jgi:hypothetical protein